MQKHTRLMRRVKKLLENKNNKFKRKYFLLSALAETNIKENKSLMSEAECYSNVLLESNGHKPTEDCLVKLYEDSLRFSKANNIEKKVKFILNYNDMLNSKINIDEELIIDDELSLIVENNYKLNNKLHEVLIESIEKRVSILMESEELEKVKGRKEFFNILDRQEEMAKNAFIENPAKINLAKQGYTSDKYVPGKPRLGAIDKLAADAIDKIKESNVAKRKFDIIKQIHFYLNVQQKENVEKALAYGKSDLRKSKEEFGQKPSGLSDDQIKSLQNELDEMLKRNVNREALDLETDIITEMELISLLFRSAGSTQRSDVESYLRYLNKILPLTPASKEETYSDPSLDSDLASDELERRREDLEDQEASGFVSGTDEPMYLSSPEEVAKAAQLAADQREKDKAEELSNAEFVNMSFEEAVGIIGKTKKEIDGIKKALEKASPGFSKMLDEEDFTMSDFEEKLNDVIENIDIEDLSLIEDFIDDVNKSGEVLFIKLENKMSKVDLRDQIYQTQDPASFASFIDNIETDRPLKLRDLALLVSHGESGSADAPRDANAIRQSQMKSWFRAMFYSYDADKKSMIYATIAEKWFKGLNELDLIKDEAVQIPGMKSMKNTSFTNYFKIIEDAMTKESNIKKFLTDEFEINHSDDEIAMEINNILDVNLTGNTGFRMFATTLMKEYYNTNIWPNCETDIAYSIKEYFEQHYPSSNIGKDLQRGQKSRTIKPENGKAFFDTIIYAVMGRTGIKDSKGTLATPDQMVDQRKDAFRNKSKFLDRVAKFNADFPQNKLKSKIDKGSEFNNKDLDALIDDMFDLKNGIIGKSFSKFKMMSSLEDINNFVNWINSIDDKKIYTRVAQSLAMNKVSEILEPNTFMKPSEIKKTKDEAIEELKSYMKLYKEKLNVHIKNLKIQDAVYVLYNKLKCDVMDYDKEKDEVTIEDENGNEYIVSSSEVKIID